MCDYVFMSTTMCAVCGYVRTGVYVCRAMVMTTMSVSRAMTMSGDGYVDMRCMCVCAGCVWVMSMLCAGVVVGCQVPTMLEI